MVFRLPPVPAADQHLSSLTAHFRRIRFHPKWGPTLKISLLITLPLATIVTMTFVAVPVLPWAIGGSGVALGGGPYALWRRTTGTPPALPGPHRMATLSVWPRRHC